MKEIIIFLFLFLAVFGTLLFVFNGRFIYAQIKYSILGAPENFSGNQISNRSGESGGDTSLRIPQRLVIPVLGVEASIVLSESPDEGALQSALEKGVAFWPGSALLGEKGTMIILGHSSAYPWYAGEYGSVFSLLNKLKENDEIFVFSADKKYTYRIVDKEINLPEDLTIEKQEKEPMLYLLSCWPIKTNWKRIAIKAVSIDKN
jgi:LPXTG-site transpeptidase (sortase) family protein